MKPLTKRTPPPPLPYHFSNGPALTIKVGNELLIMSGKQKILERWLISSIQICLSKTTELNSCTDSLPCILFDRANKRCTITFSTQLILNIPVSDSFQESPTGPVSRTPLHGMHLRISPILTLKKKSKFNCRYGAKFIQILTTENNVQMLILVTQTINILVTVKYHTRSVLCQHTFY